MAKKKEKPSEVVFKFSNPVAAEHFASWLAGRGEQDYWEWMGDREEEEDGNITGLDFDYNEDLIISVKCGRLDVEDIDEDDEDFDVLEDEEGDDEEIEDEDL